MPPRSVLAASTLMRFSSKFVGSVFYLAIPAVAAACQTSTEAAQWIISAFLLGASVSQLFAAVAADTRAKRDVLRVLIAVGMLGTCLPLLADSFALALVGMLLLGFSMGPLAPIGNAMIDDTCGDAMQSARTMALTSIPVIWAPAIAVPTGSLLVEMFSWRSVFVLSAALLLIVLAATRLPALAARPSRPRSSHGVLRVYLFMLRKPGYLRTLLALCLPAGAVAAFYTSGLTALSSSLPPEQLALVPFILVLGNSLGRLAAGSLMRAHNRERVVLAGSILTFVASMGLAASSGRSEVVPLEVAGSMFVYMAGLGATFSILRSRLMRGSGGFATASESLSGLALNLAGLATTTVTNIAPPSTIAHLGVLFLILSGLSLVLLTGPADPPR